MPRRYKCTLRIEFAGQCVYCRIPDTLRSKGEFGVDHYKPSVSFPDSFCEYTNLLYACNLCNSRKGDFWPSDEDLLTGLFLPNPCDHIMGEHVQFDSSHILALTRAGKCLVELLLLDDLELVSFRDFILKSITLHLEALEKAFGLLKDEEIDRDRVLYEIVRLKNGLRHLLGDFSDMELLAGY